MIFPNDNTVSYGEIMTRLGEHQAVLEEEAQGVRRSLEWAREAHSRQLRSFYLNFAFVHGRRAARRHAHQRELVRMASQKDAYCSATIGTMVYTLDSGEQKAHGVVVGITPESVRVYITHSNLVFFSGIIDVPRETFWDYWDFKD